MKGEPAGGGAMAVMGGGMKMASGVFELPLCALS